jgi:hypothetical protein
MKSTPFFRFLFLSMLLGSLTLPSSAQTPFPLILDERARATAVNDMLDDRFNNLLPELMRREGIDMWILISREYNEDPVMKTMLPAEWLSARRRTVMVFFDRGPGQELEKTAIAR